MLDLKNSVEDVGFSEKAILFDVIDDDGISELGNVRRAQISVGETEMIEKWNSYVILNDDDLSGLDYGPSVVVCGGDLMIDLHLISYEMWDHDVKSERRCTSPAIFLKGYWVHRESHFARCVDRRQLTWIWLSSSCDDPETAIEFVGDRLIWCRTIIFLNFMTFSWKCFWKRLRLHWESNFVWYICYLRIFGISDLESDIVRYIGSRTATSASRQNLRFPSSDAIAWISGRRSRPRRCHDDLGERTDSDSVCRTLTIHR